MIRGDQMIRQLVNCKDTKICHVNSVDNTPTYEALTSYQAGCVVQYAGVPYMAIVDIADDDPDTPDIAPSKWAIVSDAGSLAAEGELTNLDTRLSAIENVIDGSFIFSSFNEHITITGDGIKTISDLFGELSSAISSLIENLPDGDLLVPLILFVQGKAFMGIIALEGFSNTATSFNFIFNRSQVDSSSSDTHYVKISDSAASNRYNQQHTTSSDITFSDNLSSVLPEGNIIDFTYAILTHETV